MTKTWDRYESTGAISAPQWLSSPRSFLWQTGLEYKLLLIPQIRLTLFTTRGCTALCWCTGGYLLHGSTLCRPEFILCDIFLWIKYLRLSVWKQRTSDVSFEGLFDQARAHAAVTHDRAFSSCICRKLFSPERTRHTPHTFQKRATKEARWDETAFGVKQWRAACVMKYWVVGTTARMACHCFTPNAVSSYLTSFLYIRKMRTYVSSFIFMRESDHSYICKWVRRTRKQTIPISPRQTDSIRPDNDHQNSLSRFSSLPLPILSVSFSY